MSTMHSECIFAYGIHEVKTEVWGFIAEVVFVVLQVDMQWFKHHFAEKH